MNNVKDQLKIMAKLLCVAMVVVLLMQTIVEHSNDENLIGKTDEMCTIINFTEEICDEMD